MESLKQNIKNLLFALKNIIKSSFNIKGKRYYVLLFIIVFFISFIISFPYSTIALNYIKNNEKKFAKSIVISDLEISIFNKIHASGINILTPNRLTYRINNADINLNYLRLIKDKSILLNSKINSLFIQKNQMTIITDCLVQSDINLNEKNIPVSGFLNITGNNFIISKITVSGFNFNKIAINKIICNLIFSKDTVKIKNFSFTGKDLNGQISGSLKIGRVFDNSILDFNIEVNKSSGILKDFEMFLIPFTNPDNGRITIQVSGTLRRPSFTPKKYQESGF